MTVLGLITVKWIRKKVCLPKHNLAYKPPECHAFFEWPLKINFSRFFEVGTDCELNLPKARIDSWYGATNMVATGEVNCPQRGKSMCATLTSRTALKLLANLIPCVPLFFLLCNMLAFWVFLTIYRRLHIRFASKKCFIFEVNIF